MTTPGFLTKHEEYLQRYGYSTSSDPDSAPRFLVPILEEFQRYGISSGGGYHASAIHWDGASYLRNASPTGSASNKLTAVAWFKSSLADDAHRFSIFRSENPIYQLGTTVQIFQNGEISIYIQSDSTDDWEQIESAPGVCSANTYHSLLLSLDNSVEPLVRYVYLDDAPVSLSQTSVGGAATFNFDTMQHALVIQDFIMAADDPSGLGPIAPSICDSADVWISVGQAIDFSVVENRRKFVSAANKPVFLGANGELPTGSAPTVFFSGNSSTFGTNRGTCGAFTLTGSLTNATTSPSD